ncbi:MAG TPA: hypothetical protein VFX30_02475 [bacterium]|nr:hypothetical protein [bacterium]
MTDAPTFQLTGTFVPVTVESMPPDDSSLPSDVRTYSLTLDDGNAADPTHRIYEKVTIYQPPDGRPVSADYDRTMREHNPPLERHLVPIGNHYEVAYMTNYDWNRYQEAYTSLLSAREETVRSHSLMSDLGVGPASNPMFRPAARPFNEVMFVQDFDVPTAALGHLRRTDLAIPGRTGELFDARGFVATNTAAEDFLISRGYVQVGTRVENGAIRPLFLPPLDAQLYRESGTI